MRPSSLERSRCDQADLLGPADELGDGALRELQPLGELGHGRLLAAVGRALDHQQQQVALRRQAGGAGVALRGAHEAAQRGAELGDRDDLGGGQGTGHAGILVPGGANSTRGHAGEQPGRERLGERGDPVPARDEHLALVVLDRREQPLGDELRLDHEGAEPRRRSARAGGSPPSRRSRAGSCARGSRAAAARARSSARRRAARASRPCTGRPSRRPPCRRRRRRSRRRRARQPRARAERLAGTRRRRGSSCASPPRSAPASSRRKPPRPGMPALLTSSETRGCRSTTAAAVRSTASRSPTSQSSHSAPSSSASGRSRSSPRASRTQSQPRPRSARAIAAPIPLEPPVTTATRHTRTSPGGRGGRAMAVGHDRAQDVAAGTRLRRAPGRSEQALAALPLGRDQALAVEEPHRPDAARRAGGHEQPLDARGTG